MLRVIHLGRPCDKMNRLLFDLFLLKISGVVNLIVICNEDSIHVFHLTDHFHAFVVA